jgi:hypothetical protein
LAYAEKPQNNDPGEQNALQLLQNWCKPANRVEVHTFEKFPNDQLRLIYTHFLLNYRENNRHTGRRAPLVIRPPDRPDAQDLLKNFYELLDDSVNEVPSKLAEPSIAHILKYNLKAPPEVRVVHKTEDPMEWENP